MVLQLGGGARATVSIGGSGGIRTTTPVSYTPVAAPRATPVSYTPVSTPRVTPVASPTIAPVKVTPMPAPMSSSPAATVGVTGGKVIPVTIKPITTIVYDAPKIASLISSERANPTVGGVIADAVRSGTAPTTIAAPVVYDASKVNSLISTPKTVVGVSPTPELITINPVISKLATDVLNVSTIQSSIPKVEEKLVIQQAPVGVIESSITPKVDPNVKYSERVPKTIADLVLTDAERVKFNEYKKQMDINANTNAIPIKNNWINNQVLQNTVKNPVLMEHPASQAYPLQDNSVYGGEELVGPQPTSFEWTMPAGKIGPNYVDAQGNIMSYNQYVQQYNVDPEKAYQYMRSGAAANELAGIMANRPGQKSAQLSTIVAPVQYIQNPISAGYQQMEHPASQAYPLYDNSVYGGEELVGPQPTSFEWTMPAGRVGPNYVDAQGAILSRDAYYQKYSVDPELALQYMRSNQAGKELANTIYGRPYQSLSTIG
jgi:hypothetical protein